MNRRGLASVAAAALVASLAAVGVGPSASAAPDPSLPLLVSISDIEPGVIPARGTLTLRGNVTNTDTEPWDDVNVYPVISTSAIASAAALAEGTQASVETPFGTRLVGDGQYATLGRIAPGETTDFIIRLSGPELRESRGVGVYWFGAHALGTSVDGRDITADGIARTTITVAGPDLTPVRTALVVPIREPTDRRPDGSLRSAGVWQSLTGDEGRLGRLLHLFEAARAGSVSALVDPAVLDAADDARQGNPPFPVKPREMSEADPEANRAAADPAETWLDRLKAAAAQQHVLGLGYADPDLAALSRHSPNLADTAMSLSAQRFTDLGVRSTPTAAPANGLLPVRAIRQLPAGSTVLVTATDAGRQRGRLGSGQSLFRATFVAEDGLAARQRVLAETTLHSLSGQRRPLTLVLPTRFDPGPDPDDWLREVNRRWVSLTTLPTAASGATRHRADYPDEARSAELGRGKIRATEQALASGAALAEALVDGAEFTRRYDAAALTSVSEWARTDAHMGNPEALAGTIRRLIGRIAVDGTDFATLSGGTGSISVSVVNGLSQPISVRLKVDSAGDVEVGLPDSIDVAAGQRVPVRLAVTTPEVGIERVTIRAVTKSGEWLGSGLDITIRTSTVGRVIWVVLGAGGLILAVMVGLRIRRGLKEHKWRGQ